MATKAPSPRPTPTLENFYSVGEAAVRLGLKSQEQHDAGSKAGERWLRDGVNLSGWPCHRMSGQLMFADSDLAEIAAKHRNAPDKRVKRPRRPRRTATPKTTAQSAA